MKRVAFLALALLLFAGSPVAAQNLFEDVSTSTGVVFEHNGQEGTDEPIGTGAAWFDYDRDGDLDLLLTRRIGPNVFYQQNADGTFTEVATQLGVDLPDSDGAAVAIADYNNDGWLDIYFGNSDEDVLMQNVGGTFVDVTATALAGLALDGRTMGVSWGDYDDDGFLDLYVTNHMHLEFPGEDPQASDRMFHNNGDGTFTDVTTLLNGDVDQDGIDDLHGRGFIGAWTDFDKDGDLDILLINDCPFGPVGTKLFRNDGGIDPLAWHFTEVSAEMNAVACENGMGIAIGDYNNDGWIDYYYTNITESVLLKNLEGQGFEDAIVESGLFTEDTPAGPNWVTWGANFYDYDLDGDLDLFVAAGSLKKPIEESPQPNQLWENLGDGTFVDVSLTSGMNDEKKARTSVYADYDRDGDPDMFIVNYNDTSYLFENTNNNGNHWAIIDLEGRVSNANGIGAWIELTTPDGRVQHVETHSGTSIGGGDDLGAYFGLGTNVAIDQIRVYWPSGLIQTITSGLNIDERFTIVESGPLASLTPTTYPITIPAGGGEMDLTLAFTNHADVAEQFDGWLEILGPGITVTRGPLALDLDPGETRSLDFVQSIPGSAPAGAYTMSALSGDFPTVIRSRNGFSFDKADGSAKGDAVQTWSTVFAEADVLAEADVPTGVSLVRAYPNPFNPQTTIQYQLGQDGNVRLAVYDLLGREVAMLVNGPQPAGEHRVTFEAQDLPSGLYLYRLQAGLHHVTGTLMLTK